MNRLSIIDEARVPIRKTITSSTPLKVVQGIRADTRVPLLEEGVMSVEAETTIFLGDLFSSKSIRPSEKWSTQIRDLGEEQYKLLTPLTIIIEEYPPDETVMARYPEFELFGEARTESEAIKQLKEEILDLFDELTELHPTELGDLPLSWKRILKTIIAKG